MLNDDMTKLVKALFGGLAALFMGRGKLLPRIKNFVVRNPSELLGEYGRQ